MTSFDESSILTCQGIHHSYSRGADALQGISLTISPGVTALVGVNGAGKSTLLSILAGGLKPTSGTVRVRGEDLYGKGRRRALPSISMMPQHLQLPATLTAEETVALIGWLRGLSPRAARKRAPEVLGMVGLADRRRSRTRELSGGMRRRLALAQALTTAPSLLILDEPSTGLDPEQRHAMVGLIEELDTAVVMSSHVMEDVTQVAARVLILDNGRILFDGPVERLEAAAPTGTSASKLAEAGFLTTITAARSK